MKEFVLKLPQGNIHYWYVDNSANVTLVFLHGLTADHRLFDRQIAHFKEKYNCLVWDAPCHGKSRPFSEFSYEAAARALKQILDERKIAFPILIGQSMGGYVSQTFIKLFPKAAQGFISIDSCPYGERYYSKWDLWWLKQVEWMSKLCPVASLKKAIARQCTYTEDAQQNMLNMLAVFAKHELCHLMGSGYKGFIDECQDIEIPCPIMLIVGENDKTGKVITYNKLWAEAINHPLHWIKNAAHNSNDDNPDVVNSLIGEFIAKYI